jgi:hypothetical protein
MNPDFYPTPDALISRMIGPYYNRLANAQILEPSAGSGAILDYISSGRSGQKKNLYAIEKDPELTYSLHGKDYKVIHNDFLTYSGDYLFDLILMNPPFSNGDEHLLKAWDILVDGDITCLLNRETINNPCTARRKQLAQIIADHGTVEEVGQAFSQATRRTLVDVVMVRLRKEGSSPRFDFSFAGATDEKHADFNEETVTSELAMSDMTGAMLRQYEKVKDAYVNYVKARKGIEYYSGGLLNPHVGIIKLVEETLDKDPKVSYNQFLTRFKADAWSNILGKLNMGKYLTNGVMTDFEKYKKAQGAMDLTRENLVQVIFQILANRECIMQRAIVDVFDKFTQYHKENRCHVEGWKTNEAWKVNKKVILPGYLGDIRWSTYYSTCHNRYREFADIEKVMCYLTGTDYDKIESLERIIGKVRIGETAEQESTFFYFRCFKKGTLHLRFKDDRLWSEFNLKACQGKNWLPS